MTAPVQEIARQLVAAERQRTPLPPLTETYPELAISEAYAVQLAAIDQKVAQGARVVGKKIGLTSKVMQQMFAVDQPDYGHLLDTMAVASGGEAPMMRLLQPRVEGEIAFLLKQELRGPGVTEAQVLAATEAVMPAIEIIDSRIRDWKIKLADTIADNASSGFFVLGDTRTPVRDVDLRLVGMVLEKNGEIVGTGAGAAALGNPASAVAWLANKLAEFGLSLNAGEVILSGSLAVAPPVTNGDVITVQFAQLGTVTVRFV
jgi:2-keto-4-pentenoate hydratase